MADDVGCDDSSNGIEEKNRSEKMKDLGETHGSIMNATRIADENITPRKRTFMSYLPWGNKDMKEHSNLPGWPDNTPPEVLEQRPHRLVLIGEEQRYIFGDNFVKTSRYEWYSFLPMFLGMEFNPQYKISNVYFLVIAAMQVMPAITNTFGIPIMLAPLSLIVIIDMIFVISEDVTRHRADAAANAATTRKLDRDSGIWRLCQWWQLDVGDIVLLRNWEEVPADIIVLGVHEPHAPAYSGSCYVETKSLDGETNLKVRNQIKPLVGNMRTARHAASLVGSVTMEHPNKIIGQFTGTIRIEKSCTCDPFLEPVGHDNLLLRGTVLRNTKWVFGLVVNTGHDTKVMMAMTKRVDKSSQLNSRITAEIKGIALLLVVCCFTGALGGTIFNAVYQRNGEFWYLNVSYSTAGSLIEHFFVQFFYLFLLLYGFIPISLYVTQNFVRFLQAMFMNMDLDMYHEETDTPARVRTMNLNEDLGQISHVFSDKTGTLTENVMDFRKCVIAGKAYGLGTTEIGAAANQAVGKIISKKEKEVEEKSKEFRAPHVNFYDPRIFAAMHDEKKMEHASAIREFFRVLALCHTVIPESGSPAYPQKAYGPNGNIPRNKTSGSSPTPPPSEYNGGSPLEVTLSASSPDEEALVLGAKYFGYEFCDRQDNVATLRIFDDVKQETAHTQRFIPSDVELYAVNHIFGFNSIRKRMSVVIRRPDGHISLLCKGADTTVIPLLKQPESGLENRVQDDTFSLMEIYANEGLRTLIVAAKDIPQEVYNEWNVRYSNALSNIVEYEKKNSGKPNLIDDLATEIEEGISLLGVTAIEDRLQKGVGETIEKLIRAGVTVWVITGDKEETAINIGVACQLIWHESRMERIIVNAKTYRTVEELHAKFLKEFQLNCQQLEESQVLGTWAKPRVLVIDGPAFALMEDSPAVPSASQSCVYVSEGDDTINGGEKDNIEGGDASNAAVGGGGGLPEGYTVSTKEVEEGGTGHDHNLPIAFSKEDEDENTQVSVREAFLQLATVCQAVVGCRMTPDQKRQLVVMVKDKLPGARTLAIGDGANDVPMIQAAHVGVGISGQEGLQSVNASDYAFAQFRFLQKLLLCHGRYNYWRMSRVTTYLFYKSIVWGMPLALYTLFNSWSGQFFYDFVTSNLWALFYTSLPIVLFGIYDMDVCPETCLKYPWLYRTGLSDNFLQPSVFWGWVMQGVLEGVWITLIVMFSYSGGSNEDLGATPSNLMFGNTCFAIATISVNLKMLFIQHRWHWVELIVLVGSTALMFAFGIGINRVPFFLYFDWDFFGTQDVLMRSAPYWSIIGIGVLGILCRDVAWRAYHRWWQPKLHHVLMEMEVAEKDSIELPVALRASYEVENIVAGDARERLEMARHLSHINIRDESIDSASLGLTVASSHGESGGPSPRSSYIRPLSLRPYSAYYGRGSSSQLGMHALLNHPAGLDHGSSVPSTHAFCSPPSDLRISQGKSAEHTLCTFSEDELSATMQANRILYRRSMPFSMATERRRSSLPSPLTETRKHHSSSIDSSGNSV